MTVFEGDDELGLGPDEEAIALLAGGRRAARADRRCPRSENFWQAGPTGPCGPVLGALHRPRRRSSARPTTCRAATTSASWSTGTSCSCSTTSAEPATAPARSRRCRRDNIDTGLGLNRLAAILQDKRVGVRDRPVPAADRARRGALRRAATVTTSPTDRALRILADHARAMTFLIADGVVPSNEDRGYVLRRVMRRAIQQGRAPRAGARLPDALRRPRARADGRRLPRAARAARPRSRRGWPPRRRASGARSTQGMATLRERDRSSARATRALRRSRPREAFRLHDTFGFPYELTRELLAEEGLAIETATSSS